MARVWKVTWESTEDGCTQVGIHKNDYLQCMLEIPESRVRTIAAIVTDELRKMGIKAEDEVFIPAGLYMTALCRKEMRG